jgi:predicted DNA-binding transcriptional regulator AlpA
MENVMKKLLSIDEVCDVTRVSKPTIYRKVKQRLFPSPIKVPRTATRGPKTVNRWFENEVLDYCLRNNLHEQAEAVNAMAEEIKEEVQEAVSEVVVARDEFEDHSWDDDAPTMHPEPWYVRHHFAVMAVGGLLAGLAVWLFS